MVVRFEKGDILRADADALVMGRGIALQFKRAFPANFRAYAAACQRSEVEPGRMFVHETGAVSPRLIINFPTKRHWRGRSQLKDIASGLDALVDEIVARHVSSIAIPPLGAGLGGLDWRQVRPLIEQALQRVPDVDAVVFEPNAAPELMAESRQAPRLTPGRAALVGLIGRYLDGMLDTSITLLELHKLMYFLQRADEPLKLNYVKAPYGPYAENLRHVLATINGHLITGYVPGDAPYTELELVPDALDRSARYLAEHPDTDARFQRVGELVDRFESPFGLELLATVDWVATQEHAIGFDAIRDGVYAWNKRKQQFTPQQIRLAVERLRNTGFVPPAEVAGPAT